MIDRQQVLNFRVDVDYAFAVDECNGPRNIFLRQRQTSLEFHIGSTAAPGRFLNSFELPSISLPMKRHPGGTFFLRRRSESVQAQEMAECSPRTRGRGAGCALGPIRIPIRA